MTSWTIAGSLQVVKAIDHSDLLAEPVAKALHALDPADADRIGVAAIDADYADTAAFCATYGVPLAASANCVVVTGRRADTERFAACVVLATMRADVNGVVRRHLGARRASFAAMDQAIAHTGMAYGGITPIGLPADWPILLAAEVAASAELIIGAGVRTSKLLVPGEVLAKLSGVEVLPDLGRQQSSNA